MAFTATNSSQSGSKYYVNVRHVFTDGTELADEVAADLSAMSEGFTNTLRIEKIMVVANPNLSVLVECNNTQAIYVPLGGLAVVADFRMRDEAAPQGAGDLTVTTVGAANTYGLWMWAELTLT